MGNFATYNPAAAAGVPGNLGGNTNGHAGLSHSNAGSGNTTPGGPDTAAATIANTHHRTSISSMSDGDGEGDNDRDDGEGDEDGRGDDNDDGDAGAGDSADGGSINGTVMSDGQQCQ